MRAALWTHDSSAAVGIIEADPKTKPPARAALTYRGLTLALATSSAVSALGGGIYLLVWGNDGDVVPRALLAHTPFTSFLIPALLLTFIVGGTSLACAILVWRRSRVAIDATMLAGGALTVWIVAEAALLRDVHWLHGVYGIMGAALLWLGVRAGWLSNTLRHRWVISVTLAETVGYFFPTCAGVVTTSAGFSATTQAAAVIAAGFIEGLLLGAGQAWAFRIQLRRLRFAMLTSVGAGLIWLCVMSTMSFVQLLPTGLAVLVGLFAGLVGLAAIGSAQWLELRNHARGAHRWIAWTALAWASALPLSFAPGPLVDPSTPLAPNLVLWICGGMLMAFVMAHITWQGVRRLSP